MNSGGPPMRCRSGIGTSADFICTIVSTPRLVYSVSPLAIGVSRAAAISASPA
jgi:hypothetical protein